MTDNPLLQTHRLPPFSEIKARHIVPALRQLTEENLQALDKQLESMDAITWETLAEPLEERDDRLRHAWSAVRHLNSVANDNDIRTAFNESLPILSAYGTAMSQNEQLYQAFRTLAASAQFEQLNQAQRQSVIYAIRDFKLSGVGLPPESKARYGEIQSRLSALSNQFSNNVLDATQGWFKHVQEESCLAGLPEASREAARQAAQRKQLDGWVLTLDGPVYLTVMTQAHDRQLREEMYTAFMTRASDQGPTAGKWDNTPLLEEILTLRAELAVLLGYNNYAELSLATKMADSPDQVLDFLQALANESRPAAEAEVQQLRRWCREEFGVTDLQMWDVPYYSEKLKERRHSVSQESLRPYFPLARVLEGLFWVARELFEVEIKPVSTAEVWHPDVRFFAVEREGQVIAHFYLDLFAREGKRGGAWMADCRVRRRAGGETQLPVAYLVCNFSAPANGQPALLTHAEITTLFHEFGHGLHHMLTAVDVASVSGINGVAWDAVELPSQFMENWCWEKAILQKLSAHVETGDCLPDATIDNLVSARNFQSALMMLRQLEFALFDLRVHLEYGQANFTGVQDLLDQVRNQVAVLAPPRFNRFQHSFSHIFAGGYAAGYYSYKWAEVLSADAFAAFGEKGIFDRVTGQRFLTEILQRGGSQDAMTLFKNFRGREPEINALLKQSGIRA